MALIVKDTLIRKKDGALPAGSSGFETERSYSRRREEAAISEEGCYDIPSHRLSNIVITQPHLA